MSQAVRTSYLSGGALVIAVFSVLSRLLGVVRDRLLAGEFGAGPVLDAYYAAFKLPDFIFNIFVLGAFAAAFIPVFIRLKTEAGETRARELVQSVFNLLTVALVGLAIVGWLLAPQLMHVIAPGFDSERLSLALTLTRTLLLAIVALGASNVVGSFLQAERRFTAFALAPVAYNLGIILGLYIFVPRFGAQALGWGVVFGSLLHLAVQLPDAWRSGFRWAWRWGFRQQHVREVGKLLVPRTIGLAASSFEQLITTAFVSILGTGSVAAYALAVNLQSFPINVFGVSLAVAAFPVLAQAVSTQAFSEFRQQFSRSVRRILFFVLPLSVLFLVLRAQIVRVVLGSGAFDWTDTIRTAQVLGFLSLAMVAESLVPLVARAFYAMSDTRTPAVVSLLTVTIYITLLILFRPYGLAGVGLAYVCSRALNVSALLALLGRRLGSLGADEIIRGGVRMSLAALAAGIVTYATLQVVAPIVNMRTFVGIAFQGVSAGLLGVVCYLAFVKLWRLVEVQEFWLTLSRVWLQVRRLMRLA